MFNDNSTAAFKDQEHFLVSNSSARLGFSVKEGCIKLSQDCSYTNNNNNQEEEVDMYPAMDYKNMKRNGGNPNLRKREKCCARGHWKPSEDAKLREVVAIYGPQNWNLIAEKLQGRSGK